MSLARPRGCDGLCRRLGEGRVVRAGGGFEGTGLQAANEPADDLGGVGGGLLPEDAAREEAGDGRV